MLRERRARGEQTERHDLFSSLLDAKYYVALHYNCWPLCRSTTTLTTNSFIVPAHYWPDPTVFRSARYLEKS
ncbi:hypothetical protein NEOLEDRAFT_1133281 [Neolentinus lepideus HHB14362 ss-1]|uniref:Uncharacterized protein n=1 Tax=Neolentinus lepideus HHB14362 ss-1 TaxID=1314782 RepID=A0A165SVP1_9AGAM|nr:hypothetical protein NEOLEDRAFT_1133281 [Neolentinus lepideus HHB14362 ss-1]